MVFTPPDPPKKWTPQRTYVGPRLGRRFGGPLGGLNSQDCSNLRPKMAPSWSQNGIKIDTKIGYLFDAFEIFFGVEFWWNFQGKWRQVGTQIALKIDLILKRAESARIL